MKIVDMAGQRFGHLVAVESTGTRNGAGNLIWRFVCDCGKSCELDGYMVRCGRRVNCQQRSKERVGKASITHGASETPEFATWTDIQTRCHNPNSTGYSNYGGRGIKVCQRWRDSFSAFLEDMGVRPHGMSIERINNDGNYEPGNCKWATRHEQARNRRTNRLVTIAGITKNASEWAEHCGIPRTTMWARIKNGWTGADLLKPLWERR